MKTLNEKLSEALTEKGRTFNNAQIEFVLNSVHEFNNPNGLTFYERGDAKFYIREMIETFVMLGNTNKFESDFNYLK